MNVTAAFMRASGGSMTDKSAAVFDNYMSSMYQKYDNLTGWLGETLSSVKDMHTNFMNSRMWEFSNRINGKDGQYVGRFDIGYLSEVKYQQQAVGFMRDYIMANPMAMELYQDGRISGYDGDFHNACVGIGRDNYFYNRSIDGKVMYDDEKKTLNRTMYTGSNDELAHLSIAERVNIHRTWQATNLHIANNLFDPTSGINDKILSLEEVEERRKEREAEENE